MTKTDSTTKNKCDWCNNHPVDIQRRYQGESYCANCYRTWFVKKPCSRCNIISRLHQKEEKPVCNECHQNQPCRRCGKDAYIDGANTEYGRVCKICYQGYFRAKKQCQECGEHKVGVSRYTELSHDDAVCVSCYQRQTRSTCSACRRFRKVVETPEGQLCKKCHELGEIDCPCCSKKMPAGFGKRCWDCYWSERLQREVKTNLNLFKSNAIKTSYKAFISWFVDCADNQKVVLEHIKFTTFFKTCDMLWHKIPIYKNLVQEFKPEGLRHNLTVLRWLIDTEQVTVDLKIKDEIAEKERIVALLSKFEVLPESIESYYEFLNGKLLLKQTTLKSIRLALQPAVGVYIELSVNMQQQPSQAHLDTYLRQKHGQYNAIHGFVSHINRKYGSKLQCNKPDMEIIRKDKVIQLEKDLMTINQVSNPTKKDGEQWIIMSLEYFHSLKLSKKDLWTLAISQDKDRIVIEYQNQEYVIPFLEKLKML